LNKDRKREDSSVTVDSGIGDRLRGGLYDIHCVLQMTLSQAEDENVSHTRF